MRVLLTGGGTAGHINPALAIAHTIKRNVPHAEIAFVGIQKGKETELVPREGYPLYFVDSMGFERPLWSPVNIKAAWLAFYSPRSRKTKDILKRFQPDIVIGTGGYACYPLMAAAIRMGIPCALHESNALPGLVVKKLHRKVDRVWLNFEHTASLLEPCGNEMVVGNPLREGFGALSRKEARRKLKIADDRFVVLSFGGSLGAQKINDAVLSAMRQLSSTHPELLMIHATGKREYDRIMEEKHQKGLDAAENYLVSDYIYDMPCQMAAADLVICRAGAMTLSELALMKKACILIPSPNVTDNHQYLNAKVLSDAGAAELIEEAQLQENALGKAVLRLMENPAALHAMEKNITAFARGDANQKIWDDLLRLIEEK